MKSESFEDADPLLGVAVGAVPWSLSFWHSKSNLSATSRLCSHSRHPTVWRHSDLVSASGLLVNSCLAGIRRTRETPYSSSYFYLATHEIAYFPWVSWNSPFVPPWVCWFWPLPVVISGVLASPWWRLGSQPLLWVLIRVGGHSPLHRGTEGIHQRSKTWPRTFIFNSGIGSWIPGLV